MTDEELIRWAVAKARAKHHGNLGKRYTKSQKQRDKEEAARAERRLQVEDRKQEKKTAAKAHRDSVRKLYEKLGSVVLVAAKLGVTKQRVSQLLKD
jgi:hypothetical protein